MLDAWIHLYLKVALYNILTEASSFQHSTLAVHFTFTDM